jgi:hypothetical protein
MDRRKPLRFVVAPGGGALRRRVGSGGSGKLRGAKVADGDEELGERSPGRVSFRGKTLVWDVVGGGRALLAAGVVILDDVGLVAAIVPRMVGVRSAWDRENESPTACISS